MSTITPSAVERFITSGVPEGKAHATLRDDKAPGLSIRLLPSGSASWLYTYRVKGLGRSATPKTVTIGRWGTVPIDQARIEARKLSGKVAAGADPRAEIVESARRDKAVLAVALDDYERWITARKLAKVDTMMSALRRGLSHLLQKDLAELDRRTLVDAIERIEKAGKPGAARDFRKHLSAFLERQSSIGVVTANTLAGYRMATPTRDDRAEAEEAGMALDETEIIAVWKAAVAMGGPFGGIVRLGLATGLRRGELAMLRWEWIDREAGWIAFPAKRMKAGKGHIVRVTPLVAMILDAQADRGGGLVFPSERRHGGATMISGWSKLLGKLRSLSGVDGVGLQDLRKTFRSALADIGVPEPVAETMIAHARSDLISRYNKAQMRDIRRDAAMTYDAWLTGVVLRQDSTGAATAVNLTHQIMPGVRA